MADTPLSDARALTLNRSVVLYRLAFGQPRQDDLLALLDQVQGGMSSAEFAQLQISLRPD